MNEFINDVSENRAKYLGGSDIPVIMDLSPFRSRFELIKEKALGIESDFTGNEFTEYGHIMEPKIRDYLNETLGANFVEYRSIDEQNAVRVHLDGYDPEREGGTVLEIKTTSQIKKDLDDYVAYKVQTIYYMDKVNAKSGIVAVYDRPEDFSEEFDENRLFIFGIYMEDEATQELARKIEKAVEVFKQDVEKLRQMPGLEEKALTPIDVTELARAYVAKADEIEREKMELNLLGSLIMDKMETMARKKYIVEGYRIAYVEPKESRTELKESFDTELFRTENQELYKKYTKLENKKIPGRKGSLRFTNIGGGES